MLWFWKFIWIEDLYLSIICYDSASRVHANNNVLMKACNKSNGSQLQPLFETCNSLNEDYFNEYPVFSYTSSNKPLFLGNQTYLLFHTLALHWLGLV